MDVLNGIAQFQQQAEEHKAEDSNDKDAVSSQDFYASLQSPGWIWLVLH